MIWETRHLNEYDYEWLCEQLYSFVAESPGVWGFGDAPRHGVVLKFCLTQSDNCLVVQRGPARCGFISWEHAPQDPLYPNARLAVVTHWYVSPHLRGTRAGYLLVREFHGIMKQRNVTHTIMTLAKDTKVSDNTMCRLGYDLAKTLYVRRVD